MERGTRMSRKLKRRRFNNFFPYILSFLTAALLWFFVVNINHIERTMNVAIIIQNLSPSLSLASISSHDAVIRLRGNREILDDRFMSTLRPVIDLKNAVPGTNSYTLSVDKPYIPANISIVSIKPSSVVIGLVHISNTNKESR